MEPGDLSRVPAEQRRHYVGNDLPRFQADGTTLRLGP